MVDIETLSTRASATILQIGILAFDPQTDELGGGLEIDVSWKTQGRDVCPATKDWWLKRAKEGIPVPEHGNVSLAGALDRLRRFWEFSMAPDATVWAWGTSFDLAILEDAAHDFAAPGKMPWRYSRHRCARTVCALADVERTGEVAHAALADAEQAAEAVCRALRVLAPDPVPDFERGWMRYRRELAETHPCIALLPAWADCPLEVRESFVAGVLAATEPQPPQNHDMQS